MTLTEFLLARVDEDEEAARAAAAAPSGCGYPDFPGPVGPAWEAVEGMIRGAEDLWDNEGYYGLEMAPAHAVHIARHDPARVLAECEVKRKILELHPTYTADPYRIEGGEMYYPLDPYYCDCQCPDGIIYGHEPCETKRVLALPYADHPDYLEEWKP